VKAYPQSLKRARGVALIAVLWLVAVLTLLATTVASLSVSHRRAASRYASAVELDQIADSAIRLAILRIIGPKSPNDPVTAGVTMQFQLFDSSADVVIEREQGRIDLNTADDNLLFAFFAANGWSAEAARDVVARIGDWKDPDDDAREHGAEQSSYVAAHLRYTPRNGPLESVDELRQIVGVSDVSPALFESFTVYTHSQSPSASLAPAPVKRAMEFADKQQLGGHRWLSEREGATQSVVGAIQGDARTLVGEVVRFRSCARKKGAERCRLMVARLTGSTQNPLQVFVWQGAREGASESAR
jgi:general secretion pathway protein K